MRNWGHQSLPSPLFRGERERLRLPASSWGASRRHCLAIYSRPCPAVVAGRPDCGAARIASSKRRLIERRRGFRGGNDSGTANEGGGGASGRPCAALRSRWGMSKSFRSQSRRRLPAGDRSRMAIRSVWGFGIRSGSPNKGRQRVEGRARTPIQHHLRQEIGGDRRANNSGGWEVASDRRSAVDGSWQTASERRA